MLQAAGGSIRERRAMRKRSRRSANARATKGCCRRSRARMRSPARGAGREHIPDGASSSGCSGRGDKDMTILQRTICRAGKPCSRRERIAAAIKAARRAASPRWWAISPPAFRPRRESREHLPPSPRLPMWSRSACRSPIPWPMAHHSAREPCRAARRASAAVDPRARSRRMAAGRGAAAAHELSESAARIRPRKRLPRAAARPGCAGFIVPDLPFEESGDLERARARGSGARADGHPGDPAGAPGALCRESQGFVYAVTMTGTTGKASRCRTKCSSTWTG